MHDMRVRTRIGDRNFAFGYRAKKGKNRFCGVLRRIGCRYLQVHIDAPQAKVYDCRILRTDYPAEEMPLRIGDGLRRKIDESGVRTLKRCMHEHYEDCPWREQALYAMDSRNQMLFGSYVFKDNEGYVKANLRLMSKGLREDGLLELCFPARVGITIPSFSCYFGTWNRYTGRWSPAGTRRCMRRKTGLKISAVQAVSVTVGLRSAVIFTGNTRKRYAI